MTKILTDLDDQTLIELALKEEKQAFDVIVKRYQNRVAGLVNRYIWDKAEVSDITQDIFLRAYLALPQFRGDSSFSTWLFRITINYLKNILVTQKRKTPTLDINLDNLEGMLGRTFLKDLDSPEQVLQCAQSQKKINEVIDSLSDDAKMAFILRELEGLSYDDIADILSCPVGTVRSRLFRAREIMEKTLHEIEKE